MESEKDLSSLSTEALIAELAKRQQTLGVRPAVVEENFQKQGRNNENRSYDNYLRGLEAEQPSGEAPCPVCKTMAKVRVKNRARTIYTLSGEHRLRRHYHYCGSCEKGFYALDRKLELREKGEVSEALEKRLIDCASLRLGGFD